MKSLLHYLVFHCFLLGFSQYAQPFATNKQNQGGSATKKAALYYDLAWKTLNTDYNQFTTYKDSLFENSNRLKDKSYLASYYYLSGINHQRNGKFLTSINDFKKGLQNAKKNDTLKAVLFIEMAHSHYLRHEVKDSVMHYLQLASKVINQKKLIKQKRLLDFMRSISLSDTSVNYEDSVSLLLSLLQKAEKRKDKIEMLFYSQHLGRIFEAVKNEPSSKRYLEKALFLSDELGCLFSKGEILCGIALRDINQKNYSRAISGLKEALYCFERVKSYLGICQVNTLLAQVYAAQGDLISAQPYALKGFELLKDFEYSGNLNQAINNVKVLKDNTDKKSVKDKEQVSSIPKVIKIFDKNRELLSDKQYSVAHEISSTLFSKALTEKRRHKTFAHFKPKEIHSFEKIVSPEIENQELQKLLVYKEQNYKIETQKNISELETRYRTAQKENKIKQLTIDKQEAEITSQRQKNLRNYSLLAAGTIFLFSTAGYFIYSGKQKNKELIRKNTELKLQQEIGTLELSVLNKRLNPHFINNALTAMIPAFQRNAPDFYNSVVKLTRLIGSAFENESLTDSIAEQLEGVQNYIDLQKLIFKDQLQYTVQCNISNMQQQIPRLLLQNLVENAVEHGIERKGKGQIIIRVTEDREVLTIEIEDDGCGRTFPEKQGVGTATYQNLFSSFNTTNNQKATLLFTDKKDESGKPSGTIAKVSIPKTYYYKTEPQFA